MEVGWANFLRFFFGIFGQSRELLMMEPRLSQLYGWVCMNVVGGILAEKTWGSWCEVMNLCAIMNCDQGSAIGDQL